MAETYDELIAQAQAVVDEALNNEIGLWGRGVLQASIWNDVYRAYTPRPYGWVAYTGQQDENGNPVYRKGVTYKRRYDLPSSVYSELKEPGVLFISTKAKPRPSIWPTSSYDNNRAGAFLELLAGNPSKKNGGMGLWHGGFPRPALKHAQEHIDKKLTNVVQRMIATRFA